jgi:hypothetical protein
MSLRSLLNQSVDVYRLAATTGSKKQHAKVATIRIMIAPMSAAAAQTSQLTFGRAYNGYVSSGTNVLIGDYLQDSTGIKYDVQGAMNYTMGSQPLISLTLQRQALQGQV